MRKIFASNFLKRAGALLLVSVMLLGSFPLMANAVGSTDTDITAIAAPATKALIVNYDQWVVNVGASLRLPQTVTVTLADGSTTEANVTWDTTTLDYATVGTYRLAGEVALPQGATNGHKLTVVQKVVVREYLNLLKNPGFEEGTSDWCLVAGPTLTQISSPVQDGAYAIASVISKKAQRANYISQDVTAALNENGAGEYYISTWGQLGENAAAENDDRYWTRLDILADGKTSNADWKYVGTSYISDKAFSPAADSADGSKAPVGNQSVAPVKGEWRQSHRRVMLNFGTINNARIEVGITGGSAFVNTLYIDHAELVPLNVTLPASSLLGEEEEIVEVSALPIKALIENYDRWVVDVSSSLRLPQTVSVVTDKGNAVQVEVEWNAENLKYDTLGEYELTGRLKASEAGLANTGNLTATQKVLVRSYQNLLKNPSFEDGVSDWKFVNGPTHTQVSSPVQDGSYAIASVITSRAQRMNYISQSVTEALNESGAGEYYISTWGQLGEDAEITDDDTYWTRLDIQADGNDWEYIGTSYISSAVLSPAADSADGQKAPVSTQVIVPAKGEWRQSHRRVMLNFERIDQARIEVGITGGSTFASKVYIDHAELVPLNVTLPTDNDIAGCASLPEIRVYEGTAFDALELPNTVQVTLKDGKTQSVPVIWNEGTYLTTPGTYIIGGRFDLTGLAVMNSKRIAPQITVVVRATGETLRDTYYFSTSGDDGNDGLTEATPKKSVELIPGLLRSGANVLLKRGDIWYLPEFSLNVDGVKGASEDDRITLGAYGDESDPKPILGFMYQKTASEWKNEGNNVYSADVSKLTAVDANGVSRVFVDGTVYSLSTLIWGYRNSDELAAIDDPANLEAEEFCVSGNRVYIKTKGQSFDNVELVPWGTSYGHRLTGTDVSYLTIENLDLRGGSTIWAFAWFGAPSRGLLIENTDFLYVSRYILQLSMTGVTAESHVNPTVRGCTFDGMLSEKEGADYRIVHAVQSIEMREAIDGALIEKNVLRNVGHAAVELSMPGSNTRPEMSSVVSGVKNCIVQNNLIEGANSGYARAFTITGHTNTGAEHDLVHDNIIRWNECYGMTTSAHLLGENNAVYGNIFAFSNLRYDGWNGQPYAIDTVMWDISNGKHVSKGNVVLNNTFYGDVAGIALSGEGENLTDNLYANNLFANHLNTNAVYMGGIGVLWENAEGTLHILNNGFYTGWSDNKTAIGWNGKGYTAEQANRYVPNAKDNLDAQPSFRDVDESVRAKYDKCFDFSLRDDSVYRYAGLDINELEQTLLQKFPILQKLDCSDADGIQLKDLYGNEFLRKTPSVGAISYTKTLNGTVASVEEVAPKTVKLGTSFASLELPRTVEVTLSDGTKALLAVQWNESSYQAATAGTQSVTGTLSAEVHPNLNLNGKTVSCKVTVKEQLEITELLEINGVTVPNGTAAENVGLPGTCRVILEDGATVTLEVRWNASADFDAGKAGTYTFVGVPVLTADTANTKNLQYSVPVTVQKKLGKGDELLINPDFLDNGTYAPWVMGWSATQGKLEVTTDPALVKEGEPAAMIVTANTRYSGLQQDVTTQLKNLGNGKYLFELWIRALKDDEPITTSKIDLQAKKDYLGAAVENIGTEYVRVREILDVTTVEEAEKVIFHTSTFKDKDDVGKSFVISGCSLIYLGADDAEAAVTLDRMALTWDTIRGENESQDHVTAALVLPTGGENGSKITWTSDDEAVIFADGRVTPDKKNKTVTLTAAIEGEGYTDYVQFTLLIPGTDPEERFTVTFEPNGGTAVEKQTVKLGEKVSLPAQPTRSGYTFGGWYKDAKLAEKWDFENDAVFENLTLYAKWSKNAAPATGDDGSPMLFIAASAMSMTALTVLVFLLAHKKRTAEGKQN